MRSLLHRKCHAAVTAVPDPSCAGTGCGEPGLGTQAQVTGRWQRVPAGPVSPDPGSVTEWPWACFSQCLSFLVYKTERVRHLSSRVL